jgi:hypothetical protein
MKIQITYNDGAVIFLDYMPSNIEAAKTAYANGSIKKYTIKPQLQTIDFLNVCIEDIERRLEVYGWKEEWRYAYQVQLDELLAERKAVAEMVGA